MLEILGWETKSFSSVDRSCKIEKANPQQKVMSRYKPDEIKLKFKENIEFLNKRGVEPLCRVLALLDDEVVNKITEKVIPISSKLNHQKAFWLSIKDMEKRAPEGGIAFFSEDTWDKTQEEIEGVIAHEFAHAYLDHPNPLINKLTREEICKLEKAADQLASEWLGRSIKQGDY